VEDRPVLGDDQLHLTAGGPTVGQNTFSALKDFPAQASLVHSDWRMRWKTH